MRVTGVMLAAIFLRVNAEAQDQQHLVVPHLEADGTITWVATIDAITVRSFEKRDTSGTDRQKQFNSLSGLQEALNHWLDEKLLRVPWCVSGWYYLVEDPNYIEELSDGGMRVLGACRKVAWNRR